MRSWKNVIILTWMHKRMHAHIQIKSDFYVHPTNLLICDHMIMYPNIHTHTRMAGLMRNYLQRKKIYMWTWSTQFSKHKSSNLQSQGLKSCLLAICYRHFLIPNFHLQEKTTLKNNCLRNLSLSQRLSVILYVHATHRNHFHLLDSL